MRIEDVTSDAKFYFSTIDRLAINLFSNTTNKIQTQLAAIAAEVLFLIAGFGKKLTKQDVSDLLYVPYANLQRPLELLKKYNLIKVEGKGYRFIGDFSKITNEESWFEMYAILYGDAVEWYSDKERHFALINLIYTISTWLGLGVPTSERRRLTKCLCFNCFNCCSDKHWAQAKKDLLTIKKGTLQERFDECNYSNKVLDKMEFRKEKNIRFHYFNLAKQYLYILTDKKYNSIRNSFEKSIGDEVEIKTKNGNVDLAIKTVVKNAINYFPNKEDEALTVTTTKRIKYLLEYIVYQPILKDDEFNPFSPFFGKDLNTRLNIIQDTIGRDSKMYSLCRDRLSQEQYKAIFNCKESNGRRSN